MLSPRVGRSLESEFFVVSHWFIDLDHVIIHDEEGENIGADMILFEQYDRKAAAISRIGEDVRADARISNTTISYTDPAYGTDVIREYPSGHRERLKADGSVVAVPPRGG